ncbi:hypothetical protein N657DRAFT_578023, partial [Parathielavia appendiculata]
KWGRFREQCNKVNRIGETSRLKLVFSTRLEARDYRACTKIARTQRRLSKMTVDVER